MKQRNYRHIICILLLLGVVISSCKKEQLYQYNYDGQQLAAKQLVGTWTGSADIETPVGVPGAIFQNLSIIFRVDQNGNPGKFYSEGSDAAFVSAENATWEWANDTTTSDVVLKNVDPITKIWVDTSVKDLLTVKFVSDWHDTEGHEGKNAQFKVTLSRQK